jgi:glutamate-1-semialdehyde 2,1-aminomutase
LLQAAGRRPVTVVWRPGLLTVFFAAKAPRDLGEVQQADLGAYGAWCRELLARGVYAPPSQFEAWFPSLAHDDDHVDRTLVAAAAAFAALEPSGSRS